MRGFYIIFDAVVLAGPLSGSLLKLRSFWQGWCRLLLAWGTVSVFWIVLDILSVIQGWWQYNDAYILGPRFCGLPIEEIGFFFIVPFASTVLYYALRQRVQKELRRTHAQWVLSIIAGLLIVLLFANIDRQRTVFDCIVALLVVVLLWLSRLIAKQAFWYWNILVFICCLIFDMVLTAVPVFIYNDHAITGFRIGSIPLEDFIYNFSLLSMFVLVVAGDE